MAWLRGPSGASPRACVGLALALAAFGAAGCGAHDQPSAQRSGLVAIGAGLRGPQGLAATVYATGLPTASAFALDARGRLWVATSAASDHRKDAVYVIPRAGARPVKVVTGVRGPLGLTWYRERLYVASIGRVQAFSGLHGTRFAQRTTILAEPAGHGWNNSIVPAPDGRLVMSISSACDHCASKSRWSATIVSFRPDGSDVRVFAKGIRAGYGLAFYPGASDLLVSMNQRDDLGARTPGDWLANVAEGDDWRFPECYGQGGAACSGVRGPLGLTWYRDSLYVASLGRVDAYSRLHGAHFARRRTILVEPAWHGWNNSIVQAPNGRMVMSISSACDHCTPTSKWSATIVSFRPDGSDVRLYAKRIRAGFGLALYPGTSDLLVSMNQRDDLGARTPGDWLARVRQGQDWRFPQCYGQATSPCAGVPRPIAVLDKHAAAGGVAVVTGQLGASVGSAALVAEWQASRVLAVALTKTGSAVAEPLLTGIRNPLALATTRDGALLAGDWGTGKIYRVVAG